jgi:hypothetical protein
MHRLPARARRIGFLCLVFLPLSGCGQAAANASPAKQNDTPIRAGAASAHNQPPDIHPEAPSPVTAGKPASIPLDIFDADGDAYRVEVGQILGMGDRYTGTDYVTSQPLAELSYDGDVIRLAARTPGNYRIAVTASDKDGTTKKEIDVPAVWPRGGNPFRIRGIALDTWGPPELQDLGAIPRIIDLIAQTGANYFELSPYWQNDSVTGCVVRSCADLPAAQRGCTTPTDGQIRSWIRCAHSKGLAVLLKPHWIVGAFQGGRYDAESWQINPADPAAWFASYAGFILHYAEIARDESAEMFAVGNELMGVQTQDARWYGVIRAVRAVYGENLTYSDLMLWQSHPGVAAFWGKLDCLGLPFYVNGSQNDTHPTIAQMADRIRAGLSTNFAAALERYSIPAIATEFGRPNFDGTNYDPWDWTDRTIDNQELVPRFEGFFVWVLKPKASPDAMDWDFRNGPLRAALELWFSD